MHHHILRTVSTVIVMATVWAQPALADPLPVPAKLTARIGSAPTTVEVYEPHLSTEKTPVKRRYSGYRFDVVADLVFGPMWRDDTQAIEFQGTRWLCLTHPGCRLRRAQGASGGRRERRQRVHGEQPPAEREEISSSGLTISYGKISRTPQMFKRGASGWPYQVVEILRVNISDERLRPAGLDPALDPAIDLVRTHCLTCHKLNGIGGDKVPGDLAGLARSLDDAGFRAWVLDPRIDSGHFNHAGSVARPSGRRTRTHRPFAACISACNARRWLTDVLRDRATWVQLNP